MANIVLKNQHTFLCTLPICEIMSNICRKKSPTFFETELFLTYSSSDSSSEEKSLITNYKLLITNHELSLICVIPFSQYIYTPF